MGYDRDFGLGLFLLFLGFPLGFDFFIVVIDGVNLDGFLFLES